MDADLAVGRRLGQGGCACEEAVHDGVGFASGGESGEFDAGGVVDAGPTAVAAVSAVLGGVLGCAVLDAPRAFALNAARAPCSGERLDGAHWRHDGEDGYLSVLCRRR
jgi:hypothetical protein